ncbi:MAG: DNA polymerase III subunit delta' [Anaerolineae bacterium]|nr:DNA polymerase III subunit delta' [Anaerolineae bacterium]
MRRLIGHEWALEFLENAIRRGDVSHSYLFTGPRGVGKRTLALEFAKALCCRVSLPPCGHCRDCRDVAQGRHPDVKVLEPDNSSIKIEQIRELQREAFLAPHRSPYRIFIIADTEKATPEAANSLLKTLEEPPPHSIFILTALSADLLLPTIVSRCQVLNLRPLPDDLIREFLEKKWGIESSRASLLARISEGCVGKAVEFLKEERTFRERTEDLEAFLRLIKSDTITRLEWAEAISKEREEERVQEMVKRWILALRDMLLLLEGMQDMVVNVDFKDELRAVATKLGKEKIRSGLKDLRFILEALSRNANLRIVLDVLVLKLPGLVQEG